MVKEFISKLPPDKLTPFKKHPYQVREDVAMDELVESVRTYGILSPLLARPKGEGYELVSGHRRRLAAQKLGLHTVPVLVREMTDDEAVILIGRQQPSAGKPAAQRKGVCLQDEVGGHEQAGQTDRFNFDNSCA